MEVIQNNDLNGNVFGSKCYNQFELFRLSVFKRSGDPTGDLKYSQI